MKQFSDFDLSIIMPFKGSLNRFKSLFLSKVDYYQRNGIEVIIVIDGPAEQEGILGFIRTYPFICWKMVVNSKGYTSCNVSQAFNIGIRLATKQYVMIMNPELEFYTDVIYELREKLDSYPEHYAIGQMLFVDIREEIDRQAIEIHSGEWIPYGSIMAKKEYFERIGG